MKPIGTLDSNQTKECTVYKYKGDDGLHIYYSHGRMEWYRSDKRTPINLDSYKYWD